MRSEFRLIVWLLLLVLAPVARAEPVDENARLAQRLATRQDVLEGQKDGAEAQVREQALLAYRLTLRRELGFVSNPESRLEGAEAADLALASLGKGLAETRILAGEIDRVTRANPYVASPGPCAGPWWARLASVATPLRGRSCIRTELSCWPA
jgi:hypothetical protein